MLITPRFMLCALATLACAGAVAACGSDDKSASPTSASATTQAGSEPMPAGKHLNVGLVADVGGLNDRSFNALANKGLHQAKAQLGVGGRVLTSKTTADYVPNLSALAQQKYDLVVGVGFLMADAVATVARKFPDVHFAIVDVDATTLKGKPRNVEGLLFKEQQAGYLAGYLAGLYAKDHKITTVSSVGGQKIPPVDRYIAGFQAGAKAADPSIKTLNDYSQDFADQAKCKELALNQIGEGSGVVFAVAGQCGLGALDAAKEKGKRGIGVDADQGYLGPHILTSAIKKVDVSVVDAIKQVQDGQFRGGANATFDVKAEGAGIGALAGDASSYASQLKATAAKLADGTIAPPATVR
jgi:basic membrane protein A and related proteins